MDDLVASAFLAKIHTDLDTQENRIALINAGEHAASVGHGLRFLHSTDPNLITPKSRSRLIAAGQSAHILGNAMGVLHSNTGFYGPQMPIIEEHIDVLCSAPRHSHRIAQGMRMLNRAPASILVTAENIKALRGNGEFAEDIARGLVSLHNGNLANTINLNALAAAGPNAKDISMTLITFSMRNRSLITQGIFTALCNVGNDISKVYYGIGLLEMVSPTLITNDVIQALISASSNAKLISYGIRDLYRANPALITPQNLSALVSAGAAAVDMAKRLIEPPKPPQIEKTNERQIILESLKNDEIHPNDEMYERIHKLLDPVTLEAIIHPHKITGDATNQYFEFHTLMALNRDREGHFAHPLTREKFKEENIVNCADQYASLFDEVVEEIKAANERKFSM
jgi:hypothetical protein